LEFVLNLVVTVGDLEYSRGMSISDMRAVSLHLLFHSLETEKTDMHSAKTCVRERKSILRKISGSMPLAVLMVRSRASIPQEPSLDDLPVPFAPQGRRVAGVSSNQPQQSSVPKRFPAETTDHG